LPFDGVVWDTYGGGIVAVDWYFRLRVAKVFLGAFKTIPSGQSRNRAPSLALAADATMNHKIKHSVRKAPYNLIGLPSCGKEPMKK
jgi:hypothetical protein